MYNYCFNKLNINIKYINDNTDRSMFNLKQISNSITSEYETGSYTTVSYNL